MGWLLVLLLALLSGVVGLVLGGLAMAACVVWYRVSSFEGKAGFVLVGAAVLGGLFGIVMGLVVALTVPDGVPVPFLRALGLSCGILFAVAVLFTGIARMLADVPPKLDGKELELEFEIRLPADRAERPAHSREEAYVELGAMRGHVRRTAERGALLLDEARHEDGRWILPGWADVFTGRGERLLTVHLGDEPVFGFLVPMPGRPRRAHLQWSGWEPRPNRSEPPLSELEPSFRFRVVLAEDPGSEEEVS